MNYEETKKFMEDNKEVIISQWQLKMQEIFNFDRNIDEEDLIEENSNIWWFKVVEAGWEPKIIRENVNLFLGEDNEETMNVLIELNDDCTFEAIRRLSLPEETIQL